MADPEEALNTLASLALRSESPDSVAELVAEVRTQPLPDPGPCIVLVMKTVMGGESTISYSGTPEWASATLRAMADKIDDDAVLM